MDASPYTYPDDRLIDYFCVVGAGEDLLQGHAPPPLAPAASDGRSTRSASGGANVEPGVLSSHYTPSGTLHPFRSDFLPHLLDRYPVHDWKDAPFPTGVANFCLPMNVRLRRPRPPVEPLPSFFVFVATGAKGEHMFGHVLTFWERASAAQEAGVDVSVGAASAEGGPFFLPKSVAILSRWNLPGFRAVLTEMYRISLSPNPVPMERYIGNVCGEVPLPPAGRVEVEFEVGHAKIVFRRPPKNKRVSPYGLPFREVFECLDLDNILKLVRCLLTEKQVLLVSSQLTLLTATAEVLIALIYPFKWLHTVIPVLPKGLLPVVHSPVPYIVGMHVDQYREYAEEIPTWTVQVHLDSNTIITDPMMTVPHFPAKQAAKLARSLRANADVFQHRGPDWRFTRLPNFDSAFDFGARPEEVDEVAVAEMCDDVDAPDSSDDERGGPRARGAAMLLGSLGGYYSAGSRRSGVRVNWHATRRAFFRVFVSLFQHYRDFLRLEGKGDGGDATPRVEQSRSDGPRFNKRAFVEAQPRDARPFLEEILDTQLFADFIDDRLAAASESDVDIAFFDQSIDAKVNRSRFTFTKRPTPFLSSREHVHTKTVVCASVDVSALPGYPSRMYAYTPFPRLRTELYARPRQTPTFADAERRAEMETPASRVRTLTRAAVSISRSREANVYLAWFMVYATVVETAADHVAVSAGRYFDVRERAAMLSHARALTAAAYNHITTNTTSAAAREARARTGSADDMRLRTAPGTEETTSSSALTTSSSHGVRAPVHTTTRVAQPPAAAARTAGLRVGSVAAHMHTRTPTYTPTLTHMAGQTYVSGNPVFTLPPELSAQPDARARPRTLTPARAPIVSAPIHAREAVQSPTKARRDAFVAEARARFMARQLDTGMRVLERMRSEGVKREEFHYETLLEMCSRVGAVTHASTLIRDMSADRFTGHARIYRHYFQAFFHAQEGAAAVTSFAARPRRAHAHTSSMHDIHTRAPVPNASTHVTLASGTPVSSDASLERRGSLIASPGAVTAAMGTPVATGGVPAPTGAATASTGGATASAAAGGAAWTDALAHMWSRTSASVGVRTGSVAALIRSSTRKDVRDDAGSVASGASSVLTGASSAMTVEDAVGIAGTTPAAIAAPVAAAVNASLTEEHTPVPPHGHTVSATSLASHSSATSAGSASIPSSNAAATSTSSATLSASLTQASAAALTSVSSWLRASPHTRSDDDPPSTPVPAVNRKHPPVLATSDAHAPSSAADASTIAAKEASVTSSESEDAPTGADSFEVAVEPVPSPTFTLCASTLVRPRAHPGATPVSASSAPSSHTIVETDALLCGEGQTTRMETVSPAAVSCLSHRFPLLTINTLRETCPSCGRALTDVDIRAGFTPTGAHDYTTACPHAGCGTRFVPRFSVSSSLPAWRGSTSQAAGALLMCEYLPTHIVVKEVHTAVSNATLGAHTRVHNATLFWNLVLSFAQLGLPLELLAHMASEENDGDEAVAMARVRERVCAKLVPATQQVHVEEPEEEEELRQDGGSASCGSMDELQVIQGIGGVEDGEAVGVPVDDSNMTQASNATASDVTEAGDKNTIDAGDTMATSGVSEHSTEVDAAQDAATAVESALHSPSPDTSCTAERTACSLDNAEHLQGVAATEFPSPPQLASNASPPAASIETASVLSHATEDAQENVAEDAPVLGVELPVDVASNAVPSPPRAVAAPSAPSPRSYTNVQHGEVAAVVPRGVVGLSDAAPGGTASNSAELTPHGHGLTSRTAHSHDSGSRRCSSNAGEEAAASNGTGVHTLAGAAEPEAAGVPATMKLTAALE